MIGRVILVIAVWAVAIRAQSEVDDVEDHSTVGYSNDTHEDAKLDAPGLISKYGYPVETHRVITSDGYILTAHRIPHGKYKNNEPGPRPVVFLMHGLMCSSADFIVLGPGSALSYLLAEEGYDVWMGNARGNFYSRNHTTLNPDTDRKFWRFSWEHIGLYDLPAFIDYIIYITGESKMHYIGHSQGGTVFLVLNSLKPEYNDKFISFQGLAPAAYFTHSENEKRDHLARYIHIIEPIFFKLTKGELTNSTQIKKMLDIICRNESILDTKCVETVVRILSPDVAVLNQTMLPVFLSHTPAGASIRQYTHYAQSINRNTFARFNYGPLINLILYKSDIPPEFDVSKITVPAYLYYGMSDHAVNYRDTFKLGSMLGNTIETIKIERETVNHFDFIWGTHAKTEIYDTVFDRMKKAPEHEKRYQLT
ncbi:lipase 1-like [Pectinophora gossypiella]|uniref:lipase 1-like n=1 Tax=Pectinophora gossypiella TaxID=13191 RepID=UPI00214E3205|nr:lipase 1-like [Pectinophora gossypiella]